MGLDVGEKRIGVSLSDALGLLATPFMVIDSKGSQADIAEILKLVRGHGVERLVVGLPLSMDGSLGREAMRVQQFIQLLAESSPVPVESWDERLSTVAAEREMTAGGAKPGQKRQWRDAVAASLVLQAYLDRKRAAVP